MPASVRVRVTHLLLRVLSRARECSLARSAFWHASVSRVSRERLARFVTFLVSGTVYPPQLQFNCSFKLLYIKDQNMIFHFICEDSSIHVLNKSNTEHLHSIPVSTSW